MWKPYHEIAQVFFKNATYLVDKYHYVRQIIWAFKKNTQTDTKEICKKRTAYCLKTQRGYLQREILNTFEYSYTNGFTEGCNNKIKVLKRNAYGYRNFNRFRNRILHIFAYKKHKNTEDFKKVA